MKDTPLGKALPKQYEIIDEIGAGGMGRVYKVKDHSLNRIVSIKIILEGIKRKSMIKRFYREMKICAELEHTGIVKIYHADIANQMPYIVMEYIDGYPLLEYFQKMECSLPEKLAIFEKVCQAADYAHKCHIIHRDIKPSNIMVRKNGEPVLLDFGLAKASKVDRSITRTGEVLGTPQYMPIEQAKNIKNQIDKRVDVYALGGVLYHMLTNRPPFDGTYLEILSQLIELKCPPVPTSINAEIPKDLENICLKALAYSKKHRYSSANLLGNDIQNYLDGKKIHASGFRWKRKGVSLAKKLSIAICLVLVAFLSIFLSQEEEKKKPKSKQEIIQEKYKIIQKRYKKLVKLPSKEVYAQFKGLRDILKSIPNKGTEKFHLWKEKIYLCLFQCAFDLKKYEEVCEHAKWIRDQKSIEWKLSIAQYHIKQEQGKGLAADLKKFYNTKYAGKTLYHQICIHFQKGEFEKARKHLNEVKKYFFTLSPENQKEISLYSCYIELEDVNSKWDLKKIRNYLLYLPEEKNLMIEEAKARLKWEEMKILKNEVEKKKIAQEIIATITRYFKLAEEGYTSNKRRGELCRIRAQAYKYCQKPNLAMADFDDACKLCPERLDLPIFRLNLISQYAHPGKDYFLEFIDLLLNSTKIPPELFQKEFSELAKFCSKLKYKKMNFGIKNTSKKDFKKFSKQFFSEEKYVVEFAKNMIIRTWPKKNGWIILKKYFNEFLEKYKEDLKFSENPFLKIEKEKWIVAYKKMLKSRMEKLKKEIRKDRIFSLRMKLSSVPYKREISPKTLSLFSDEDSLKCLEIILNDREKSNLIPEEFRIYIRYLAARVLAHIPSVKMRKKLMKYTRTKQISTRILCAHALKDIGISTFQQDYVEKIPKNEFLQALAIETLNLPNVHEKLCYSGGKKNFEILKNYFRKSKFPRIKVLAASHYPVSEIRGNRKDKTLKKITQTLLRYQKNGFSPIVRTLALQILWKRVWNQNYLSQMNNEKFKKTLKKNLILALNQKSSILLKEKALLLMREIWGFEHVYLFKGQKEEFARELRDCVRKIEAKTPLMRCRKLMALSYLKDPENKKKGKDEETPFLDRLAIWLGMMRSRFGEGQENMLLESLLKHKAKDVRISALLHRVGCFYLERFDEVKETNFGAKPVLKRFMEKKFEKDLSKKENFVRYFSLLNIASTGIPNPFFKYIRETIQKKELPEYIRFTAIGVYVFLIHKEYLFRKKGKRKLAQIHRDYLKGKNPLVYEAAIWGYYKNIFMDIRTPLIEMENMKYESQRMHSFEMIKLRHRAIYKPKKRKQYIHTLKIILKIFNKASHYGIKLKNKSFYLEGLVLLYEVEGKYKKAEKLLEKNQEDPKVKELLQNFRMRDPNSRNREKYFENQYLLFPKKPETMIALAEHYLTTPKKENVTKALDLLSDASNRFPYNANVTFAYARAIAHVPNTNYSAILYYFRKAAKYHHSFFQTERVRKKEVIWIFKKYPIFRRFQRQILQNLLKYQKKFFYKHKYE